VSQRAVSPGERQGIQGLAAGWGESSPAGPSARPALPPAATLRPRGRPPLPPPVAWPRAPRPPRRGSKPVPSQPSSPALRVAGPDPLAPSNAASPPKGGNGPSTSRLATAPTAAGTFPPAALAAAGQPRLPPGGAAGDRSGRRAAAPRRRRRGLRPAPRRVRDQPLTSGGSPFRPAPRWPPGATRRRPRAAAAIRRRGGLGPGVHGYRNKEDKIARLVPLGGGPHEADPQPGPPESFPQPRRVRRAESLVGGFNARLGGKQGPAWQGREDYRSDSVSSQAPAPRPNPVVFCPSALCPAPGARDHPGKKENQPRITRMTRMKKEDKRARREEHQGVFALLSSCFCLHPFYPCNSWSPLPSSGPE
jgi:hypothetical protein